MTSVCMNTTAANKITPKENMSYLTVRSSSGANPKYWFPFGVFIPFIKEQERPKLPSFTDTTCPSMLKLTRILSGFMSPCTRFFSYRICIPLTAPDNFGSMTSLLLWASGFDLIRYYFHQQLKIHFTSVMRAPVRSSLANRGAEPSRQA